MIGNKSSNKVIKKPPQNTSETVGKKRKVLKGKYISPEEKGQIIDELVVTLSINDNLKIGPIKITF